METSQKRTGSEICSIRIMFPVTSDEDAIACKRKIQDVLVDKADTNIQFSIMSAPKRPDGS